MFRGHLEARLSVGQALVLPDHVPERALYVVSGRAAVNGTPVEASHMVILKLILERVFITVIWGPTGRAAGIHISFFFINDIFTLAAEFSV